MSVDAHLNRVVSDLARTIKAKNTELNGLRADIKKRGSEMHREIRNLERKIIDQEADLIGYQEGSVEALNDIREIKQMKDQIKQLQRDFDEFKQNTEQQINEGEQVVRELEEKTNELKNMNA